MTLKTSYYLILFFLVLSCGLMAYIIFRPSPKTMGKPEALEDDQLKEITKEVVMGKVDFEKDSSFVLVDPKFTNKKTYLNKETYDAFLKMRQAALKDGVVLTIVSGGRDFYHQKRIWEGKWNSSDILEPEARMKKILEYSSMPGTSRHHWGTDIDLNNLNNSHFAEGEGLKTYTWLTKHAHTFGFFQPYTNRVATNRHYGYNEEKWHWSYYPIAQPYLDFYNKNVGYNDIYGFKGSPMAIRIHVIERYVNGIAKAPSEVSGIEF